MERRKFIRNISAGIAVGTAVWSNYALANGIVTAPELAPGTTKITTLHTSDTHSHTEPIYGGMNQGRCGVAR